MPRKSLHLRRSAVFGYAGLTRPIFDVGCKFEVDTMRYFYYYRSVSRAPATADIMRYAEMFSAIGTEPRLRIMRLLLASHPEGMVVGELLSEMGIGASTLSHHLDKLRNEGLVKVHREGTFLRYLVDAEALRELLGFLYAECCTRNRAVKPEAIVRIGKE